VSPPGQTSHFQVRGHSTPTRPASLFVKIATLSGDIGFGLALFCLFSNALGWPPFTRSWVFAALIATWVLTIVIQRALFGRTLCEAIWKLRRPGVRDIWNRIHTPALGLGTYEKSTAIIAGFLSLLLFVTGAASAALVLASSPFWANGRIEKLEPFLPPLTAASAAAAGSEQWVVAPFFYALGAWPKTFHGKPVFHALPYEKGPPNQFIGHIVARWDAPDIRLIFEGPKTPEKARNRESAKHCIVEISRACLRYREEALDRHVDEIRASVRSASNWHLSWFEVENGALPLGETAQGIFLSAQGRARSQDRYIFITPGGTHQALILDYPTASSDGLLARELVRKSVRTVRISDQLGPGRAWINSVLQKTRVHDFEALAKGPQPLQRVAEIQGLLLSKISVDPGSYDAYFHIGGTALLLAKLGRRTNGSADSGVAAGPTLQTIQSAHRYAADIKPSDPRTTRLEALLIDARKLF
jgi:hypothetical protein